MTLKYRLWVTQDYWKWHHWYIAYECSTVSMALTCIISEIKRVNGRKIAIFSHPTCIRRSHRRFPSEYSHNVWYGKLERRVTR